MVQKRNYRKEYLTYDGLPKRKKARRRQRKSKICSDERRQGKSGG